MAIMEIKQVMDHIISKLITHYKPKQIILYGSFAYGEPDGNSDIDLLILKETTESPLERRVHVRRLVADPGRLIPFSPLVITPQELNQRLTIGDPFYQEILTRGKVLYVRE